MRLLCAREQHERVRQTRRKYWVRAGGTGDDGQEQACAVCEEDKNRDKVDERRQGEERNKEREKSEGRKEKKEGCFEDFILLNN